MLKLICNQTDNNIIVTSVIQGISNLNWNVKYQVTKGALNINLHILIVIKPNT